MSFYKRVFYLILFYIYLQIPKLFKMKLSLIVFLCIVLVSCSPVKIMQVQSDLKPSNTGYVYENDSVKITYRFWNEGGRMEYDVYNKLSIPLYVDWKTSAFIPNDKMVSYWRDETNTEAVSSGYYYKGIGTSASKIKAVRMERIGVIPPESMITQNSFVLVKKYDDVPEKGQFEKSSTPLRFRNYIMISNNEKFEGKVISINNSFYVSSVKKTNSNKYYGYKPQTSFYVTQK